MTEVSERTVTSGAAGDLTAPDRHIQYSEHVRHATLKKTYCAMHNDSHYDTPSIVCGAESMKLLGVRLSSPLAHRMSMLRVCCCGPGRQKIAVTVHCSTACGRLMRAVPGCQLMSEAEHKTCEHKKQHMPKHNIKSFRIAPGTNKKHLLVLHPIVLFLMH